MMHGTHNVKLWDLFVSAACNFIVVGGGRKAYMNAIIFLILCVLTIIYI